MQDRIFGTIQRYITLEPGGRLGVAVSGGADSVALLRLLHEPALRFGAGLFVLHVNHGLRGAESDADERFVRELSVELALPCEVRHAALDPAAAGIEEAAREARHRFFCSAAREHRLQAVATAHTLDDQAETVLFRLLRGTGVPGLAGIAPVLALEPGGVLVRPLLEVPREDLRAWLRSHGYPWREDSSNTDRRFARNRIRHDLLPQLAREWNPALPAALARIAAQVWSGERGWDALVAPHLESLTPGPSGALVFSVPALRALPEPALIRLLRQAIGRLPGAAPDAASLAAAVRILCRSAGSGQVQGAGFRIVRSGRHALLQPAAADAAVAAPLAVPGPGRYPSSRAGREILIEVVDPQHFPPPSESGRTTLYNGCSDFLDGGSLELPLVLRPWQPGDRYQPGGKPEEVSLKSLFQRHRVPSWERTSWPILLSGDQIVWVKRFGVAQWAAAPNDSRAVWSIREMATRPDPL